MGRLCGPHFCAALAPRELVSNTDRVLGLFAGDAALGNLRIVAVNIHHATRKRTAVKNVVEAELLSACNDTRPADTTMRDLFALPANRTCLELRDDRMCRVSIDE